MAFGETLQDGYGHDSFIPHPMWQTYFLLLGLKIQEPNGAVQAKMNFRIATLSLLRHQTISAPNANPMVTHRHPGVHFHLGHMTSNATLL